jgi:hypothetical protein
VAAVLGIPDTLAPVSALAHCFNISIVHSFWIKKENEILGIK